MIRFHYQNEESDLGPVKRPVADAKLKNGDIVIEIAMYIDSGADISMIPYHFGKALGLYQEPDPAPGRRSSGRRSVRDHSRPR